MKPILSICIPNYNRADFLYKNLLSIGKQSRKDIEIVISDNASTEDVSLVVRKFRDKFPKTPVIFHRNPANLGFDNNVIKVVSLARGKYCWLLSNDDQILPGSLEKLIKIIKRSKPPAFIFINYQRFDNRLKKITSARMVNILKDRYFSDHNDFYFTKTPTSYFKFLGINTLTMSCDIFDRQYWLQSIVRTKQFVGHNFIHVFTIVDMIKNHPSILFVAKPQVRYVSNNHRPWANYIWADYRNVLLSYLLRFGYDKDKVLNLRQFLKQDEINERLLIKGEKLGIYQKFYPIIRMIRNLLGHHI